VPELPEVETIRRDLLPIVVGRSITEAWVSPNAPRLIQLLPLDEFCRQIAGRRIEDICGNRGANPESRCRKPKHFAQPCRG